MVGNHECKRLDRVPKANFESQHEAWGGCNKSLVVFSCLTRILSIFGFMHVFWTISTANVAYTR